MTRTLLSLAIGALILSFVATTPTAAVDEKADNASQIDFRGKIVMLHFKGGNPLDIEGEGPKCASLGTRFNSSTSTPPTGSRKQWPCSLPKNDD